MLAHPGRLSSLEVLAGLFLVPGILVSAGLDEGKKSDERPAGGLAELRRDFPGRFRGVYEGGKVARRLEEIAAAAKGDPAGWEARLLAADVLEDAGEPAEALEVRKLVLREGLPPDRARAAFDIGFSHFLRERYKSAEPYWSLLREIAPDSPWTARAARFRPYLEVIRGGTVPPFQAEFAPPGGTAIPVGLAGLEGRTALLFFWSSQSLGGAVEIEVGDDGGKVLRNHLQDLLGRFKARTGSSVEVLGVNLDAERTKFEEALSRWKLSWPQHHDGRGFDGPLVRTLGIPRLPHWLLIGPDGRSLYMGARLTGKRSLEEALSK